MPQVNMHRVLVPRPLKPPFVVRAILSALLLLFGDVDLARPTPAPAAREDQRLLPYIEPGRLVDIGGRRINLHCTGAGGPTVVLMAGLFSWSVVWYKTQPVISQRTRVCAFDRAGYGFSDPGPRPQILSDVVDDLHAALNAGPIPGPYVLVGHSLGGIEARLFAQRWPKEVVGMVIVDTSPAGEGLINENQPGFDEVSGRESYAADMLHCALLVANGPLEPSSPDYEECTSASALPSDTPTALRENWPRFFTAYYLADKVSLMSSVYTHRYDSVDHRRLGAMPLVVLSAEYSWGKSGTPEGIWYKRSYATTWIGMHEALAHLSSRGIHRVIEGSGHTIQLDKPQAVIDAVDEVLRQLDTRAKP
jgi:pimeloyl-ACP methyl ester carboxylesterase